MGFLWTLDFFCLNWSTIWACFDIAAFRCQPCVQCTCRYVYRSMHVKCVIFTVLICTYSGQTANFRQVCGGMLAILLYRILFPLLYDKLLPPLDRFLLSSLGTQVNSKSPNGPRPTRIQNVSTKPLYPNVHLQPPIIHPIGTVRCTMGYLA